MANAALQRALRALAHPLSAGAVLLLLLNDQVLRWRWPSWVTGKVGDAAWLLFAPLLAAVLIALVLPARMRRRDDWVALSAIGLVSAVFALAKTWPAAHGAVRALYGAALGHEPLLVRDPSDLVVLPVLLLTWRLWRSVDGSAVRIPHRAWAVGLLAVLATLGNAGVPDCGIACLEVQPGRIVARAVFHYNAFASEDGGLTWSRLEGYTAQDPLCLTNSGMWTYRIEGTGDEYRFIPGERVDRSGDGGRTWVTEIRLNGEDARAAYYSAVAAGGGTLGPGPLNAAYDASTGRLILAMGREGVLVRDATGEWSWVAVGDYRFEPLRRAGQVALLLNGELWLAVVLALLGFSALCPQPRRPWKKGLLIALGLAWCATAGIGRPAMQSGYGAFFTFMPTAALFVVAVPLALWEGWRLHRISWVLLLKAAGTALGVAALYLVPFVLWGIGLIPRYQGAVWLAGPLVALSLLAGHRGLGAARPRPSADGS